MIDGLMRLALSTQLQMSWGSSSGLGPSGHLFSDEEWRTREASAKERLMFNREYTEARNFLAKHAQEGT